MLEVLNLGVTLGRAAVLTDVTTRLDQGQIVGLVGANGAGKTTMLNAISGLQACRGTVRWKGSRVQLDRIGYLPQQARVDADLSVTETLLLGRFENLGWRIHSDALDAAEDILTEFDISHLHARKMATLSGGQQQRVLLAQRLLRQPDLLLLDEATSALDVRHQMQAFHHLRAYVERTGALVVIAVHDLNLAGHHCDRLCLLHGGSILAEGGFEEVINPGTLATAYGIEAEFLSSRSGKPLILPVRPCSVD